MLGLQVHLVLLQVDALDPLEEESVSALFADLLKECHPAHQRIGEELDSRARLLDQPWVCQCVSVAQPPHQAHLLN